MLRYANRVHKDPSSSLSPVVPDELNGGVSSDVTVTAGHVRVWVVFIAGLVFLIWGAVAKGFYLSEISTIFLCIGLLAGFVNGYGLNKIFSAFSKDAKDMAITYILNSAGILDSIVYYLSLLLQGLPTVISAGAMVLVHTVLNFFINSGSTKAATTMPIMSPLAQILGINQQVAVLAFQLGDGLSNILWVTSGTLMIGLGITKINYLQWFKFVSKIFLIMLTIGIGAVMLAQVINWGPF